MQISIGKLSGILIALLISVTVVTTGMGLYVLQTDYRALESRHEAEARNTVQNAALAIRNQIRFYEGILQLISANPEVSNLLEFHTHAEIAEWSQAVGRLLPGTLGTALASPKGEVYGDPLALRVGAACEHDMKEAASGVKIDYPLLHTDVAGLEHFDLILSIPSAFDEELGTLFVSFRLSVIEDMLRNMAREGDSFSLIGRDGDEKLSVTTTSTDRVLSDYASGVPDTSWKLVLHRPMPATDSFLTELFVTDGLILVGVGLLIVFLINTTLRHFKADMMRIHTALEEVLDGRYKPSDAPTAIRETGILLPDIEQLALKIQQQRDELRHQSLSDPLTGIFNRRYFDLMLGHLHEQSRRQAPATLAILDLNDFKHINDEFGHAAGDRVLQHAANYLSARVRASDIVARLGGDEFAVVLNNMSPGSVEAWMTSMINHYDAQNLEDSDSRNLICHFSIGIARIDAEIYDTPEEVFNAADSAMYSVKNRRHFRRSGFALARPANVTQLKTFK